MIGIYESSRNLTLAPFQTRTSLTTQIVAVSTPLKENIISRQDLLLVAQESTHADMTQYLPYIKSERPDENRVAEAIQYSRTDSNIDYNEQNDQMESARDHQFDINDLIDDELVTPSDLTPFGQESDYWDFEPAQDYATDNENKDHSLPYSAMPTPAQSPLDTEQHVKKLSQEKNPDEIIENNLNDIDVPIHAIFGNETMQQELCGFDVKWSAAAMENKSMDKSGQQSVLYCNTADARRSNQRQIQFGFTLNDKFRQEVTQNGSVRYFMGVFLSLPGMHGEIGSCSQHRQQFDSEYFFKVFNLGVEVKDRAECAKFPNQPILYWELPIEREGDDYAMKFQFHCKSTCLKKGGGADINQLTMNFVLLDSNFTVVKHVHQRIRVTANPKRDAGGFESSQMSAKRARAGITKVERVGMKRSASPTTDSWTPPIKREASHEVPSSNSMMMVPSTSTAVVEHISPATEDVLFTNFTNLIPAEDREKISNVLLRMNPHDRQRLISDEQQRFVNSVKVSAGMHPNR